MKEKAGKSVETTRLRELGPMDELGLIVREAAREVEDILALEDAGWINLSAGVGEVIPAQQKIVNLKLSRLYATKNPLAKQAIRLWTDYTFGPGMSWSVPEKHEAAKKALDSFWDARANRKVLGAAGQRKSSNRLLIDGVVYFAIFLGAPGESKIRRIDPLEITEIITDPDDKEDEKYYRRKWADRQNKPHETIYRSITNIKGEEALDAAGQPVKHNDDALVYRLEYNEGNPLSLPALVWLKYYTKFLSSRIAIMLALAKFAWKTKVKGGQAAVNAIKAQTNQQQIAAASTIVENLGSDTTPIKTETGARNAYEDGRQIKLMIAAAFGIPEQYFGDISIGNLATAKTVELPMMKMFQSYQKVWSDGYRDIDEVILEHNKVPPDQWYVDRDFPAIAPADVAAAAQAILSILQVMPALADSPDVQQIAMITLGVNDPAEALEQLAKEAKTNPEAALLKAVKIFREAVNRQGKKE